MEYNISKLAKLAGISTRTLSNDDIAIICAKYLRDAIVDFCR
jgi:hypothetical protein